MQNQINSNTFQNGNSPPKRIWLQWHGVDEEHLDCFGNDVDPGDVTWCIHQIFDTDVEYVLKETNDEQ